MSDAPEDRALARLGRSLREPRTLLSLALGALLLAGAIVAATRNREALLEARRAMLNAPLWLGAVILLLPAASWLGTTGSLLCVMRRYGRVGAAEMASLLGVAALANYIPGRPGMVARIAYHKRVNDIRVRDSVRGVAWMTGAGAAALGVLMALALILARLDGASVALRTLATFAPTLAGGVIGAALRALRPADQRRLDLLAFAFAFRTLEMLTWAARYWAIFTLIGRPVAWESAMALAAVSNIAMAIPISGNGLGLREWAVGLLAPALPGALAQVKSSVGAAEWGFLAETIHRGVEVAATALIALLSAWALARVQRRRAMPTLTSQSPDPSLGR